MLFTLLIYSVIIAFIFITLFVFSRYAGADKLKRANSHERRGRKVTDLKGVMPHDGGIAGLARKL
jgi:hypothetical protein